MMFSTDLSNTGNYSIVLRSKDYGDTPSDRESAAMSMFYARKAQIEKSKTRQIYMIVLGYILAAGVGTFGVVFDAESLHFGTMFVAFFMNIAAFHYGKYCYFRANEQLAHSQAVHSWKFNYLSEEDQPY